MTENKVKDVKSINQKNTKPKLTKKEKADLLAEKRWHRRKVWNDKICNPMYLIGLCFMVALVPALFADKSGTTSIICAIIAITLCFSTVLIDWYYNSYISYSKDDRQRLLKLYKKIAVAVLIIALPSVISLIVQHVR